MSYADRDQPVAEPPREVFGCPRCARVHVDRGEWASRPHHVHRCGHCGYEWDRGHRSYGVEPPEASWRRGRFENAIRRACTWVSRRLPVREIVRANGDVYLSRYTLLDLGEKGMRVYLHAIRLGDEDQELHNHPWGRSLSLILTGGYFEERRHSRYYADEDIHFYGSAEERAAFYANDGRYVETREVKPLTFNRIDAETFHRVDLRDGVCWTLFFAGPITQSWGFWDRITNRFTPWREFIRAKGLVPFEGKES